jgi:hypothetical protein
MALIPYQFGGIAHLIPYQFGGIAHLSLGGVYVFIIARKSPLAWHYKATPISALMGLIGLITISNY